MQGVLEKVKVQYSGEKFSKISLPLLDEVALSELLSYIYNHNNLY